MKSSPFEHEHLEQSAAPHLQHWASLQLVDPPAEPLRAGKASAYVETVTPHLYMPTAQRPVRAKCRWLEADTQVKPHRHPWAQLAISTTGTIRLTVAQGRGRLRIRKIKHASG